MDCKIEIEFDEQLKNFLELIYSKYNYDFRNYSTKSLKRTIFQAMDRMKIPTLLELERKVLLEEKSFQELVQSLTIPVSEMFRDPTYFLTLRNLVVPHLKTYPSIKVWVAGCSTGEEAYSLAILLKEEDLLDRTTIYATDINQVSLEKAALGILSKYSVETFSQNYFGSGGKKDPSEYCTSIGGLNEFHSSLRKSITFADHSLVTDAVFSETHLISCRNVLIYFDRELQDHAIGLFYESLCHKGFLGLGSKETLQFSRHNQDFGSVSKKDRIFQKK